MTPADALHVPLDPPQPWRRAPITVNFTTIPPSTNNLFANSPNGARHKTIKYRDWITAAGWELHLQRPARIQGKVALDVAVCRPRGRADLSNRIKAVEDLLVAHGVIDDDRHVEALSMRWRDEPGCTVIVRAA